MKKILLLLSFILTGIVLFTACDPTKEYQDQYSQYNNPSKVRFPDTTTVYTLASTDYASSSITEVSSKKYFSDASPVNPNLLGILNKKYNAKISASITVNYTYYNPLILRDSVPNYTLLNADYGNTYYDFIKATDLTTYLAKVYTAPTKGKVVILTYNWMTKTTVVTNTFVFLGNNVWTMINPFALADYTAMGQSYANFSNTTDPLYNIPIYLKSKFPYAKSGDIYMVQYAVYISGKTTQYPLLYTYNGSAWIAYNAISTAVAYVNFDGLAWKFPPAVKVTFVTPTPTSAPAGSINYSLVTADYRLVGNSYDDFQRNVVGQYEEPDAVFLGKMGTILKTRYAASIAIGQIYAVTYADYAGTTTNKTVYLQVVAQ
jgi:hypothetical protein